MSIQRYNEKRNFQDTPEPPGQSSAPGSKVLRFVIQKHQASHLHYDFRLEMDGVLKSWAVPKGPSLNPEQKRLAMHVEDHPMDYRQFEGTIPKGNYGAGTVMVWDEGYYYVEASMDREENEKALLQGLSRGKLSFYLEGSKLRGKFSLVQTHGSKMPDNAWLLMKISDEAANSDDVLRQDRSAVSSRSMDEIAQDRNSTVWESSGEGTGKPAVHPAQTKTSAAGLKKRALAEGGLKAAAPSDLSPQLATLVDKAFDRKNWIFEIKWDGYRALGYRLPKRRMRLISRNGKSLDHRFPGVREALQSLPCEAIVDGEITAIDSEGVPSFSLIQNHERHTENIVYFIFDLLYIAGIDIRTVPQLERKILLSELLRGTDERLRYSDHVVSDGTAFFRLVCEQGLEGMIAKDGSAPYRDGKRTRHWLKIKREQRQEFIIAGYTEPRKTRTDIGSLLLAYYDEAGSLQFAGHVGSGLDSKTRAALKAKLDALARKTSPLDKAVVTNEQPTWVTPKLVCEVRYTEKTQDRQLRHPVFLGLRDDKDASRIRWEVEHRSGELKQSVSKGRDTSMTVDGQKVRITHPDRIYFPELGISKRDVVDHYLGVTDYILPYLKDRPMVLHRFPRGITEQGFYQKDNPQGLPDWVSRTEIYSESTEEDTCYLLCQNAATLIYLVNLGCIEMNPWNSRLELLDQPDWMLFDLDPVEIGFGKVVEVAQVIHDLFDDGGIPHYCKTSGKRGLHITVPLGGGYHNDTVRHMAESIAQLIHKEIPKITSLERSPSKRKKKVYLDYLQNGFGKTIVSPYSLRPVDYAGISTPLHWDEVNSQLDPRAFTLASMPERLRREGDLWESLLSERVDLDKIIH
ncbi:MAG: DNA ligase D [Pseudohongiellaceae bacterium]